jgi:tRNA G10  N-methylase Trm11
MNQSPSLGIPEDKPVDIKTHLYNLLNEVEVSNYIRTSPGTFATTFFNKWFLEDKSLYFLFSKNLSVTDIQFAELIALIRNNIAYNTREYNSESSEIHNLQFSTTSEFKTDISKLIEDFHDVPNKAKVISENYLSLVEKRILVDSYYGSCAVYVPPNLTLDYESICAHSGYIHSCGKIVYIRNTKKITEKEFSKKIDKYVENNLKGTEKKVRFVVYAHEGFNKLDKNEQMESVLKFGLNDLKIRTEKSYIGKTMLSKVIEDIVKKHEKYLVSPSPKKIEFENNYEIDKSKTLWLHIDREIDFEGIASTNPSVFHKEITRYYICFEQLYLNGNPFLIFDENKPAWSAPITIPHSLVSAMINVALQHTFGKKITLHDPFVGTGTTVFEANKYSTIIATGSDKMNSVKRLVSHNLKFFMLGEEDLLKFHRALLYLSESSLPNKIALEEFQDCSSVEFDTHYTWLTEFVTKYLKNSSVSDTLNNFVEDSLDSIELANSYKFRKLLFYLCARTFTKNRVYLGKFNNKEFIREWSGLFDEQLSSYAPELKRLADFKNELKGGLNRKNGNYDVYVGQWSNSLAINYLDQDTFNIEEFLEKVETKDAREIKQDSYDIIVTDPPYGFNTDEDNTALAKLYSEVIEKMLLALKHGGQLVISLPDRSYTGRQTPFFTHKEFVFQQILATAEKLKYDLYEPVYSFPHPSYLFRPPYFWESEKALRRAVLHFRIDKACAQNR